MVGVRGSLVKGGTWHPGRMGCRAPRSPKELSQRTQSEEIIRTVGAPASGRGPTNSAARGPRGCSVPRSGCVSSLSADKEVSSTTNTTQFRACFDSLALHLRRLTTDRTTGSGHQGTVSYYPVFHVTGGTDRDGDRDIGILVPDANGVIRDVTGWTRPKGVRRDPTPAGEGHRHGRHHC
jgi:hypothetical protein